MMRIKILALFIAVSMGSLLPVCGQQRKTGLDMQVPFTPEIVTIDGKPTVYYELRLTNRSSDTIMLEGLTVLAGDGGIVKELTKNDLKNAYSRSELHLAKPALPPRTTGLIYIEATLSDASGKLRHHLTYSVLNNEPAIVKSMIGAVINPSQQTPVVIGPPLSAGAWAAVYEPSWKRGHRRVVYTTNSKDRIPGRFAIDFIMLDSLGRYAAGSEDSIRNWYGYGANVLAVADGKVVAARNDFTESRTISKHPVYPATKATGNYIAIDIGNGRIAFYEHLKPGSIKVKRGQVVKKGMVIASLGFTGQTTGPHLHFHMANANSPLGAEGVPFAFEQFTLLGTYPDFGQFGKKPWTPAQRTVARERPAPNTVIRFRP